jgi:O-acetyl-ADP-ribose deacetylase (regulator of RNase III)
VNRYSTDHVLGEHEDVVTELQFKTGDITGFAADAIANAANQSLVGGGGVDGAIHAAGGPAIMAALDRIRDTRGGCPTGSAVMTTAGKLAARAVIHAVGPRWRSGTVGEAGLLASCYRSILCLARDGGMRTVAIPSISTGVYGYPIKDAASVAVATIVEELDLHPEAFDQVTMVLFSDEDRAVYEAAYREIV